MRKGGHAIVTKPVGEVHLCLGWIVTIIQYSEERKMWICQLPRPKMTTSGAIRNFYIPETALLPVSGIPDDPSNI